MIKTSCLSKVLQEKPDACISLHIVHKLVRFFFYAYCQGCGRISEDILLVTSRSTHKTYMFWSERILYLSEAY